MQEYKPLVSIIIPVYNGSNYMREAIDSAIAQTYENIEIIVVNDGSTDDGETERIALSYGDKIKYYRKENGGCASALNFAISKMQGEWFSWLSHDDVYMPNKVQMSVDCIRENNSYAHNTIIVCGTEVIDEKGETLLSPGFSNKPKYISASDMFSSFMNGQALNGCALLIPKEALDKTGKFSTEYVYILDWMYWIELSLNDYNFYYFPHKLVKNRMHSAQVSAKKKHLWNDEMEKFLTSLADRFQDECDKMRQIWTCCYRIGFKNCCKKIESKVKISPKLKFKGFLRKVKRRIRTVVRNIVRGSKH